MPYRIKGILEVTKRIGQIGVGVTGNTFIGLDAGNSIAGGFSNVVVGDNAFDMATTAVACTAIGRSALTALTTGNSNCAVGTSALQAVTTGTQNTACGSASFGQATGNRNTGVGNQTGNALTTGSDNTFTGFASGNGVATGSFNTCLGSSTTSGGAGAATGRIAIGINSAGAGATATVDNGLFFHTSLATAAGAAVQYNAGNGQMGPVASSLRFKENIADIEIDTAKVFNLRPVSFDYKSGHEQGYGRQFGLIAEEVQELFPSIVPRDVEGRAMSVNYDRIAVLMLVEMRKLRDGLITLQAKVDQLST